MNDKELLAYNDLWKLSEEQLIRRGWLITKKEAKTQSQKDLADYFMNKEYRKDG